MMIAYRRGARLAIRKYGVMVWAVRATRTFEGCLADKRKNLSLEVL